MSNDWRCIFCKCSIDRNKFCDSILCDKYKVYHSINYNNSIEFVCFKVNLRNKKYNISYYQDTFYVNIFNSGITIVEIKLETPFQLILTPDNWEKKLPILLTYS